MTTPKFSPTVPPVVEISGTPSKASIIPLLVTSLALLLSILIQVLQFQLANNIWYFIGYALTPLVTSLCLGWDSLAQRSGRKDPWFVANPIYSKIIRVLVLTSYVVAVFHIFAIGNIIGEAAVQSGFGAS